MFMKERAFLYHQWSAADVERHFDVKIKEGLSERRAYFRIEKYGLNELKAEDRNSAVKILISQFGNFFIVLLLAAAVISYFVDGLIQALILTLIVFLNVSLGFYQEFKAEKALAELKNSFKTKAKVLRDGSIKIVDADRITLGDVIILEAGDVVPADLRLIEEHSLRVSEAALTGESLPIGKSNEVLDADTPLADRHNMLFCSTHIVSGHGKGIVVAIGENTEFGKIADLITEPEKSTPLQLQIVYLGKILTLISLIIVGILFALGYFRGYELLPLLTFTIALLIGAVPESLPTIITLALSTGVSRMAKKKAIVRKLAVIESLGTTNIIATDKTGTLTDNKLSVSKIAYITKDKIKIEDVFIDKPLETAALDLFEKGVLCSNVEMKANEELLGDPLDTAIVEQAKLMKEGILLKTKPFKRLMEIPFDSDSKYMAVLVEAPNHRREIVVKGATEKVLSFCKINPAQRRAAKILAENMSEEGLKVIAVAAKKIDDKNFSTPTGMRLIGLFGLIDKPSKGIKDAIYRTIEAGIRPIILTGDHPETAIFVANQIGLNVNSKDVICGKDLEKMSNRELTAALATTKIFARITPKDKINIVDKLEKQGYSVAVTGDGVNDAPAIKRATVGIAMGIKGSDITKEAADIVLSDDKYDTIISAIEYGRTIYDNIKNSIIFLLSGNFDELLLIGFAFIFDLPMPLLTLQILWINMVTDSLPALALVFEEPNSSVLKQKPRSAKNISMKRPILYSFYLSIAGFLLGLILYLWGLNHSVEKARTLLFTFAVLTELAYVISIRSPYRFWQNFKCFFANKYLIASVGLAAALQCLIFIPPINKVFSISKLSTDEVVVLIIMVLASFVIAEAIRWLMDKADKKSSKICA